MSTAPSKCTDEFKRETSDYIISTGRPVAEVYRKLGLNSKTVVFHKLILPKAHLESVINRP